MFCIIELLLLNTSFTLRPQSLSGSKEIIPLCSYLAQGRWFRSVGPNGIFHLGASHYYLGKRFAHHSVAIGFDPGARALICQPEGNVDTLEVHIQGITKAELMGELALLQVLPMYQLALPFSLAAWRQLEYAHHLTGTTL
jgi:hypothetical protein